MDGAGASGKSSSGDNLKLVNRLNESRSPYVRGHMNNPVAWQMWGPEALALAKKHNRLLFVSIGYAACHWCHVMERESFESPEVAAVLNAHFIPIKIDREERPDIDRIYMNFVQATTGSGGWPLNVFLTPDLEPVFGGTYWPGPGSANNMIGRGAGFLDIANKLWRVWEQQQERCLSSAKEITRQLTAFAEEGNISAGRARESAGEDGDGLELDLLDDAYEHFKSRYDKMYGGFGGAPKFPTPVNLAFLVHLGQYPQIVRDVVGGKDCENAKAMVVNTLRNMWRGGIKDQVGHGFARYSVTRDWLLPHFEKMLYDQAQLLPVYLDAFLLTQDPEMLGAVYDIATYLTEPPMAAPTGGIFSSEDADSYYRQGDAEKREGAFYVWTRKEFTNILGERDAQILAKFYGVKENGNVDGRHDAHGELVNQNVLSVKSTPKALAKEFGLSEEEAVKILKDGRAKLLEHRNKERPRPGLDDKIVVGWNGLAIGALARTSSVLDDIDAEKANEYRAAAEDAVRFIKKELFDEDKKTLKRVYREGPGDAPGFADDYAFLISGLIDLYEATFDDQYLQFADTLQQSQISLFLDPIASGFFSTLPNQPDILIRLKDGLDSAEPSTNGVSARNLFRLSSLLGDESYATTARKTVEAFEAEIMQHPFLYTSMSDPIVAVKLGMKEIVVTGKDDGDGDEAIVKQAIKKLRTGVHLNTTVARLGGNAKSEWLRSRNELLQSMDPAKAKVQVCEGFTCRELQPGEL